MNGFPAKIILKAAKPAIHEIGASMAAAAAAKASFRGLEKSPRWH